MERRFTSVDEILSLPHSENFWVEESDGTWQNGNPGSFYSGKTNEHLTFDISNNKVLVNLDWKGGIKELTMYRGCHYIDYASGIWIAKDLTTTGPYYFTMKTGDETYVLGKDELPYRTSLLDNIFPVTVINAGGLKMTLLTFCPISADGNERIRGVVYGLFVENVSDAVVEGVVSLPKVRESEKFVSFYNQANVYTAITPGDGIHDHEVEIKLEPEESMWVPSIISAVGGTATEEINCRSTTYWFNQTYQYFSAAMGRLTIPGDKFIEEFFKRTVMQCLGFPAMDEAGNVIGGTWGTYPALRPVWNKDFNYGVMPLRLIDPELFKKSMLYLLKYGVRPPSNRYEGGPCHSISISISPVSMAGMYYDATGDISIFKLYPEILNKATTLLETVIRERKEKSRWLFSSRFISDGVSAGDYHTGSNILAWHSLTSMSRILGACHDQRGKDHYAEIADRVKSDILKYCVIDGPFGKQFIEGIHMDGSPVGMEHDGEESDTTLVPVYGFLPYDNQTYRNCLKFALSEHNVFYNETTRGIRWGNDATMTSYITGVPMITDSESYWAEESYISEIRKLCDMDGSLWWWPYLKGGKYGDVCRIISADNEIFSKGDSSMDARDYPGKCAWASGVFISLFVQEFTGLRFDAPTNTLEFKPLSPFGSYFWDSVKLGKGLFGIDYNVMDDAVNATLVNHNEFSVDMVLKIPILGEKAPISLNGAIIKDYEVEEFLGRQLAVVEVTVKPGGVITCKV